MDRAAPLLGLSASTLRRWLAGSTQTLRHHRRALDAVNVFPVPDADTGTNLYLTLADAAEAVADLPAEATAEEVAHALARGALVGARGNSGVILSQYLSALLLGWPTPARPADPAADPPRAAGPPSVHPAVPALVRAAAAARRAVGEPVEGTVLTVAGAVADGAATAGRQESLAAVLDAGLVAGGVALALTPDQLPALGAAGVRDAGALGLLLVLEALADALPPEPGSGDGTVTRRARRVTVEPWGEPPTPSTPGEEPGSDGEFEVMYLAERAAGGPAADRAASVEHADAPADALRAGLGDLGRSVVVVEDRALWQVHVHTDRPLEAVALAPRLGLVADQVMVRHLLRQSGVHGDRAPALGLVAVTGAPGLVPALARAGAVVVLAAEGRTLTRAVTRAVEDSGAQEVLVLATGPAGTAVLPGPVPRSVDGDELEVEVVAGLSEVQVVVGAATRAGLDPVMGSEEQRGAVLAAVRGLRSVVLDTGAGGTSTAPEVVVPLVGTAEIVTLVTAQGTPPRVVTALVDALGAGHPDLEVVVLEGGGEGSRLEVGIE
ncbi:DAK2 domain-containing protein [Actinotalea sp. BY-33]|uniref:DAK2 domain-containing protein n=1 Tax=Actinotalea soli TaxID=2819234 RepID=A0A939LMK5_9CELL|nr:DAK2 domain-containing protein [Actinotalea soli]MBO1750747.1 DAK2 domain-containing protein [Actinotalea soli]